MKTVSLLRSFRSRNYRLFFSGQAISLMGNWMTTTASMWLAYKLAASPFHVGLVGFATQIPLLVLAPFTGVTGDRLDRRRLLIGLQMCSLVQSASLATVTLTGNMTITVLVGLSLVQGFINAFEFPTRQSFVAEMVDRREDLPNAIALNSSMFNIARLLGPAIAGVLINRWSAGVCYAIDAVSYLPVILSLGMMRVQPRPPRERVTRAWEDFGAGLAYVRAEGGLRRPLLLVAVNALAGFGASTLASVFAGGVFDGNAAMLGHFYSAVGAGALLSAIILGTRTTVDQLRPWIVRGTVLVAASSLVIALSPSVWVAYVGYFVSGTAVVLVMAGSNTLIQARVADDKRSRVMGLFVMAQGVAPIGALLTGWAAAHWGPRLALGLCAAVMAVAAVAFAKPRSAPAAGEPVRPVVGEGTGAPFV
ncbi:arabinose efflux permease family protein [Opitutaceae bacterium TAV1]|nr:arabinose efflux permease family protein [Opitutaceae bacterium TAV1]